MPEYPLAPWIARELDRLEAANATATAGPWDPTDIRSLAPSISPPDAELAAAARNLVTNLVGYGRALLAEHARCVDHDGCTACKTCGSEHHYPCPPVRRLGTLFAHRSGYRMFEWMP